jgi:hypothetical protein
MNYSLSVHVAMSTGVITLNKIRPQLIKPNSCLKEIRPISSFLAVTHHKAHEIDAMSIQFSPKVENCLRLRPLAYANLILGTVSVAFQVIPFTIIINSIKT